MICAKHYRVCDKGGICQDCGKVPERTRELIVFSSKGIQ